MLSLYQILKKKRKNMKQLIFGFKRYLTTDLKIVHKTIFGFSLAGMSRSVTVAVAYIMSTTNLSWKEALKVVRVGRSIANPNVGFQQQLKDFESSRLHEVFKLTIKKNSPRPILLMLHFFLFFFCKRFDVIKMRTILPN